ncbi:MAG: transposase [Candidatus Hydrothermarchaeaceae archaeon]
MRIEYPGALYHITTRGNGRKRIFLDDADKVKFLGILSDYHSRYGILIHGYVLMDNHYHLILETPQGNLLKIMHGINSGYTGYFNRTHRRSGHLFQGRYRGILVDKDAYLLQLSSYVHLNPVRARMVEKPELYEWSSYSGYIGKSRGENWVEYSWVLSQFGRTKRLAKRGYRDHTEDAMNAKAESPLNALYGQIVLGGEEFREKLRTHLQGHPLSEEIVERKRLMKAPSLEDIIRAVAESYDVSERTMTNRGNKDSIARQVALYLAHRYSGLSNKEIGNAFGRINPSAVSKSSCRFEERMRGDKKLGRLVQRLKSKVKA